MKLTSFDEKYNTSLALQDVYPKIAEDLLAAAQRDGELVYCVPGDPSVAVRRGSVAAALGAAGACSPVGCCEPKPSGLPHSRARRPAQEMTVKLLRQHGPAKGVKARHELPATRASW